MTFDHDIIALKISGLMKNICMPYKKYIHVLFQKSWAMFKLDTNKPTRRQTDGKNNMPSDIDMEA